MTFATPFGKRVAGIFATRVARFGLGFGTSFLLAGILLPEGRGQYALLVLVPGMLNALGQLGLPSALSFFAGRGRSLRQLQRLSLILTIGLSAILVGAALVALAAVPWLSSTLLKPVPADLLLISIASLPFQFAAAFAGSILIGRQRLRNYNLIVVAQSVLMLVGVALLVGVLRLGVAGAIMSYVAIAIVAAIATAVELHRAVEEEVVEGGPVKLSQIASYGAQTYPASVSGYFSYRADVLVLSAILGEASSIGLYTFAVSLAELAFVIPDSVSTVFYPHVAGMDGRMPTSWRRRSADSRCSHRARRARAPSAGVGHDLVHPSRLRGEHRPIPHPVARHRGPLLSKVVSGYISGLGLPLAVARASLANLGINVIANVILIPIIGIAGAALASLISYAGHATIMVLTAARISHPGPSITSSRPGRRCGACVTGCRRSSAAAPSAAESEQVRRLLVISYFFRLSAASAWSGC